MKRLLTAAVLIPIVWIVIKLSPLWVFTLAVSVVLAGAVLEIYALLAHRGQMPFRVLGIVATVAIVWAFSGLVPRLDPLLPLAALAVLTPVVAFWLRADAEAMLRTSTSTLFPVMTVGLTLGYMVALRSVPGETGPDLMLLAVVCVTFSDTGAFYVGSSVGRHRMAPRLSPKKSWEGAIGGLAAAVGGGLLAHFWFFQSLSLFHAIVLGLLLGSAAILGDLAESMVKRATGAKDSSRLLPGHGGLMDRLDSMMFASPALYYYYRFVLEGAL
jgi:phosphatidate cytidylyltransferase